MKLRSVRFETKLSSMIVGISWSHFYGIKNLRPFWDYDAKSKVATEVKVAFFPCFSLIFRFTHSDLDSP